MKLCPYCSGEMTDDAIICQHCGRDWKSGVSHVARVQAVLPATPSTSSLNPERVSNVRTPGGVGFVPIAVGVGVAFATAPVAYGIMFGMAWSGIHSGRTERPGVLEIALMYVILFAPAVLGFLVAWSMHRGRARKLGTSTNDGSAPWSLRD